MPPAARVRRRWIASLLLAVLVGLLFGPDPLAARTKRATRPAAKPAATPAAPPAEFQTLAPGLDYRHESRSKGPLSIHVLRIDRGRPWQFHTGLGQGTIFGLEPLDKIVARTAARLHAKPVAAINGDFFYIKAGPYQGDPTSLQIADGELVSRPSRTAVWVAPDGGLKMGMVVSKLRALWPDGKTAVPFGLNEARADDKAVLYTPTLGIRPGETPKSPPGARTQGGRELVLDAVDAKSWLPLAAGKDYAARVREVHESGNTPLAVGRMILSLGPKLAATVPAVKPGDVLHVLTETEPSLCGVKTAVGGRQVILQDGQTPDLRSASSSRHPRSLIAWSAGYLYLIVIDGRQPELSIGVTYGEMAALAKEYQCTHALEFDGGGSSTLWTMGKILNSPSDGHLRPLANAFIVFAP